MVALLALLALGAVPAAAQEDAPLRQIDGWQTAVEHAESLVRDPDTTTATLESIRERLVQQRSAALELQSTFEAEVRAIQERLDALGPPAEDAMPEPVELAERRRRINAQLDVARVPAAEAREAARATETLISEIDQIVRSRFAAQLRERGPIPVNPVHWAPALVELVEGLESQRESVASGFQPGDERANFLRQLPLDLMLVTIGVVLAIWLRRRLTEWVEDMLRERRAERWVVGLVAIRNLTRLILPAVGAGLALGAVRSVLMLGEQQGLPLFWLPDFALVGIWAGWLAASLFAPDLSRFRPIAADDAMAARGARLTLVLGTLFVLMMIVDRVSAAWTLDRATLAVLNFPISVLAGLTVWRIARVVGSLRDATPPPGTWGEAAGVLRDRILVGLDRGLHLMAVLVPATAVLGYFALSRFLLTATGLTVALIGTAVVLYDLANSGFDAASARMSGRRREDPQGGLAPIAIGFVLLVVAAPLLALAWGARVTDLQTAWVLMRDGAEVGGIRISLSFIVQFALVFAIVYGLARLLHAVLRTSVLPRTRMDAGARNAILAGVRYTGFAFALVAAVINTGLDLSSVALVAGALSVGIGFGLQTMVSNFVAGIILLIERPIKEGDWIEVGGYSGYVRDISVRSTEIEMFDKASVIVPNQDLVAGTVLNRTHSTMSGRLRVPVPVARSSDPREVERILMAITEEHPMVLSDPEPKVLFMGFAAEAMNFEIFCYLRDVNYVLWTHSDMNFAIVERFRAAGIEIPFPQRELHLKNPADVLAAMAAERAEGEAPRRSTG